MRQGSIPAYQNTESQPWMIDILSAQCHIRPFSSDSSVQPLEPESQLTINPSLIDPSGQSPYPQNILCHQKYRCDWPTSCCCCCSTDNSSETSSSILHPNLISPILGTQLGTGKEPFHSDPSRPDLSSFVPQNPVELDPRSVRLESPMDCHQSDDNEVRYKDWIELDYQETERIDDTFQAEPSSVSDSTSPLSPSSSRKTSSSTDVCLTSSNSSNSPQISFPKQSQSTNQRSKLKLLNKSKSNTRPRTKTKTKRPKEFLERNRLAAFRSRQKKKILEIELESKLIELESQSNNLKLILESLLLEKLKLKNIIEQHHHHHHHHQSNCNNINRSKIKN
ncbi:hypothetical protein BY996DRAFT_3257644 [Phakopsora pachyrhizi]|nr:hypothetical protein BY996DRAFT_3257644 [Phakopsora pachyrhizi]